MDGLILAIDLGKFNSVCCWYDPPATKSATFQQAWRHPSSAVAASAVG